MKHHAHPSDQPACFHGSPRHRADASHSRFAVLGLSAVALAAALVGCGGGGSGGSANNAIAVIGGVNTGATGEGASNFVTGSLTITDADVGQAAFKMPATLMGTYGAFTFNASTGAWTYLIDNSKSNTQALVTGQTVYDTLTVESIDGSATQDIKVSISGSGSGNGGTSGSLALITTVPAAVYPASDPYAAEKAAVFELLNSERANCGFGKRSQNVLLDKAAQAHADYITVNNFAYGHEETPGLLGFTGTEVGERVTAAGYNYSYSDENLNAQVWGSRYIAPHYGPLNYTTFEQTATKNLRGLLSTIYHMKGLLGHTTEIGIGISTLRNTEANQKTLNFNAGVPAGTNSLGQQITTDALATYPCNGVKDAFPYFRDEAPNPFPGVNMMLTPFGQPVYLMSARGTTLSLTSWAITLQGGMGVPVTVLTKDNDPQKGTPQALQANQIFVVPTQMLADNSTYDVSVTGTNTGMITANNPTGAFSRKFSFSTGVGYAPATRN